MDTQHRSGRMTCVRTFCRETGGTSSVEYVVMLVVVLAIPIAIVKLFGVATGNSFNSALSGRPVQQVASEASRTTRPAASQPAPPAVVNPRVWLAVEGIVILFLGTALGYGVWQQHRRERLPDEIEPDEDEAVDEATDGLNRDAIFAKRKHIHRILSINMAAVCSGRLEVRHIMSTRLTTIGPDASAADIIERLEQDRLRHLLVVDDEGKLLGIISDRDALRKPDRCARDMMTPKPFTVEPSTRLKPAATSLIQRRISCLPVVENGELCGVLTGTDLILALQCTMYILESLGQEVARGMGAASPKQPTTSTVPAPSGAPATSSGATSRPVPGNTPPPPHTLQPTV